LILTSIPVPAAEKHPQHDATTKLRLKNGAWCLPDVMLGIQAKEFNPDQGPSHLIAQFGKGRLE
jgi:hypothetical protein